MHRTGRRERDSEQERTSHGDHGVTRAPIERALPLADESRTKRPERTPFRTRRSPTKRRARIASGQVSWLGAREFNQRRRPLRRTTSIELALRIRTFPNRWVDSVVLDLGTLHSGGT